MSLCQAPLILILGAFFPRMRGTKQTKFLAPIVPQAMLAYFFQRGILTGIERIVKTKLHKQLGML